MAEKIFSVDFDLNKQDNHYDNTSFFFVMHPIPLFSDLKRAISPIVSELFFAIWIVNGDFKQKKALENILPDSWKYLIRYNDRFSKNSNVCLAEQASFLASNSQNVSREKWGITLGQRRLRDEQQLQIRQPLFPQMIYYFTLVWLGSSILLFYIFLRKVLQSR